MVTIRSRGEMKADSPLRSVVLPAPVPPETTIVQAAPRTAASSKFHQGAGGQRPLLHQIRGHQPVGAEAANRQQRAIHRHTAGMMAC